MKVFVNDSAGSVSAITNESSNPKYALVLAHGAGAGMEHPFMSALAEGIAQTNGHVIRFNFPYMEKGRKAPGSPKEAIATIDAVVKAVVKLYPDLPIFLSGKSYGGRMSSHFLTEQPSDFVKGIIYFGFPMHALGKDGKERANHLAEIAIPQLFIQGTKDKLANFDLISQVISEQQNAALQAIADGDHSFKVPKKSGKSSEDILKDIVGATNEWVLKQLS